MRYLSASPAPYTTVAVREQVRRWVQHVATRWSTALGRGTYGGFVVGQGGQGLLRNLYRQVRRLLASRAASPNPDGRNSDHPTPHRCTASTARRRDTLECSEGGGVRLLPVLCQNPRVLVLHRWECTAVEPPHTPLPTDAPPLRPCGLNGRATTSGETQTRKHVSVEPPSILQGCTSSVRAHCQMDGLFIHSFIHSSSRSCPWRSSRLSPCSSPSPPAGHRVDAGLGWGPG
jgi:hypothetical protein